MPHIIVTYLFIYIFLPFLLCLFNFFFLWDCIRNRKREGEREKSCRKCELQEPCGDLPALGAVPRSRPGPGAALAAGSGAGPGRAPRGGAAPVGNPQRERSGVRRRKSPPRETGERRGEVMVKERKGGKEGEAGRAVPEG